MPFIQEAVQSIFLQSFQDWELIVIDDCSNDGTWEFLQSLDDPRIKLLQPPVNCHVAVTGNIALNLAKGKYLARLDQDDIAFPSRLEMQFNYLETHPEIDVLGGGCELFGELYGVSSIPQLDSDIKANLLQAHSNILNPTSMFRISFVRERKIYYDARCPLSCDYNFWVDCMFSGGRFANLEQLVTKYRISKNQGSNQVEEIRRGVKVMRRAILHRWFPELTGTDVLLLEPILHSYGSVSLDPEKAQEGVKVCNRLLNQQMPSCDGENRIRVYQYIQLRRDLWIQALKG